VLVVEVVYSPAAVWGKAQNHSIYNQRYANQASDVTGPLEESFLRGVCGIYKTTDCLRKTSLVQERMEICNYFVFNKSLAVRKRTRKSYQRHLLTLKWTTPSVVRQWHLVDTTHITSAFLEYALQVHTCTVCVKN